MHTPTPDQLDRATIALIFALRDSLTSDGPSYADFWAGRAATALTTAAAGSDNAAQAVTTACRKLQVEHIAASAVPAATTAAQVIDADYQAWATRVDQTIVYVLALAYAERDQHKRGKRPTTTTTTTTTTVADDDGKEIPF